MDPTTALIESQARERALTVELNAAKIALVQAEARESKALLREEAANREKEAVIREKEAVNLLAESLRGEKEAVTREREAAAQREAALRRENETLRASTGSTEEAVKRALDAQKERLEREAAKSLALAQYERDQRSIWLRSPECVLSVLVITAQNGYSAKGFKNLSRAFRYDEQLWDAIKDRCDPDGWTHLMVAADEGDVERVRWLLKRSANVNAVLTDGGDTALLLACANGHLEIARLLLDRGANVNAARTTEGFTSLMWTAQEGHLEIARLLLDRGAIVNAVAG
jgi:hypothetical protein